MLIAIIDYGSGNLRSAEKAFERAARGHRVAAKVRVTADPAVVAAADRIVLPGVGAFADCRRGLKAVNGMEEALVEAVTEKGRPFFGICVGMQLMASRGLEFETTEGFGWIPGDVTAITPSDPTLKIPHMGWNTLDVTNDHPLLAGIDTGPDGLHAYFVHSYQLKASDPSQVIATSDYGGPLTAIVARDTMVGTQFHPEKSQALGLAVIANFLNWAP
ncbi:imidazole glycerol phosphate synthase subunit HisH [Stappia taiwanensis]|uniref:Imidazole glycerol phosphate synthase subunit HisH n=1 Tax=Stappia taiwanensis TaxID=992267 RepID=A0A838XKM3_9HYPH|nr:imidazole glycerol phosphate synthase subunit HisH [Stappia taiwanensis]MBA4611879.1 imidazole glycerol phosphate synthase subunit HisH [Stappia taiwanensis]GGF03511.1 imidazole glycerol phosphate synthase subunit HisH [Stappia taiwanensis]